MSYKTDKINMELKSSQKRGQALGYFYTWRKLLAPIFLAFKRKMRRDYLNYWKLDFKCHYQIILNWLWSIQDSAGKTTRKKFNSLWFLHHYDVKFLNFTFYEGRKHKRKIFIFFFAWTSIRSLANQVQKNLPTFRKD